jgi:hypothetical protein
MYKYVMTYYDCYAHEQRTKIIKHLNEAGNLNPEYFENIQVWELGNRVEHTVWGY